MKRIAIFPGSFDPITKGHVDIISRAVSLFDEIIIAIGHNSAKKSMFTLEERISQIEATFSDLPSVSVQTYEGLTIEFCKKVNAKYILRGMRSEHDFEFERSIALMNTAMNNEIETIFLVSKAEYSAISSTIVRDIMRNGGDAKQFLPEALH